MAFMRRMSARTSEKSLRAAVERRHKRKCNGVCCFVRPKLLAEIFGDGRLLIALTPCVTDVANYYAVRVGTGWLHGSRPYISDCDAPIRDHLDEIYEAIREEFGEVEYEDQGAYHEGSERDWPLLDLTIGCSWGEIAWPFYR